MTKEEIQEALTLKRVYYLNTKITEEEINLLRDAFFQMYLADPNAKAFLLINSNGGDYGQSFLGYDFIKSLPFEIECTICGKCASAALYLLAACSKRFATKHSSFLFHSMCYSKMIYSTKSVDLQMKECIKEIENDIMQGLEIQSKAFSIPIEDLEILWKRGQEYTISLTTQEALSKGIIHGIIEKIPFLV